MYEIIEAYATFTDPQDVYVDIYTNEEEAEATGLHVEKGWIIIDENGYVAEDTHDIYFEYSEAVHELMELEPAE
jgi:hypothetical protein